MHWSSATNLRTVVWDAGASASGTDDYCFLLEFTVGVVLIRICGTKRNIYKRPSLEIVDTQEWVTALVNWN